MSELEKFTNRIKEFSNLSPSQQIKYFVYYLQVEKKLESIEPKDIKRCFDELHINPPSNIPRDLKARITKGSKQEFIKTKTGYVLLAKVRPQIESELNIPVELDPSDSIYPQAIFAKAPSYLVAFASEATSCYDMGLYNSCLFMLRKVCEILLIELFESKGIENKIKNQNGDYLQLAELIKATITENTWKLSRIVKDNLPKIKQLADSSVHSKRFKARKADIDQMQTDVRVIFEELISLIDYPIKKHK